MVAAGMMTAALSWQAGSPLALAQNTAAAVQVAQLDSQHDFDIAAQPLARALTQFGLQSGLQVTVDGALVRDIRAPATRGRMTPPQALQRLLAGSGLTYSFADGSTVAIQKPGQQSDGAVQLGPITVEGRGETAYGPVQGYVATRSAAGSKTDTPLIETPQSVSVVTRDQMDARNVNKLNEALRYTPGAVPEPFGLEPRYTDLRLRGLSATTTGIFRDGQVLSNPNFAVSYNPEPWGAERIEVPRGPASVLYGQGNPGGLVNYVTKRPTTDPLHVVEGEVGRYNRMQGKADFGGALNESRTLSYRFTALARDSDSQIDHVQDDRIYVAPALAWQFREDTTINLYASHQQDDTKNSQALIGAGTLTSNPNGQIPLSRFVGEPDVDQYDRSEYIVGYEVEHDWNDAVTLRHKLRYNVVDLNDVVVYTTGHLADQRTITRSVFANFGNLGGLTTDNTVELKLGHGDWEHTLLGGFDFQHIDFENVQQFGAAPNLDIYNPNYGAAVTLPAPFRDDDTLQTQTGFYAQDQLAYGDHWRFTIGGRYDRAHSEIDNHLTGTSTSQRDSAFTGRAGLLYLFDFGLAPYASYAESFQPVIGTNAAGAAFEPETGEQYEIGVKYQPPGQNSFVAASVFDLRRQNYTETHPATFQTVQTGEVRSRGLELEAVASFDFGLDITAGYAYLDAEVTESATPGQVGKTVTWIPDQTATLWADYSFQDGAFKGLGIGAGVRYTGENYGDNLNTLKIPAHTVVDASVHYEWSGFKLGVHAQNLFNEYYVGSCYSRGNGTLCTAGEQLAVKGTLSYRW